MSVFNPVTFLDQQVTGQNDTKLIPIPVGEFTGIAEKIEVRPWQSKDGQKSGLSLDVTWTIDDQAVKAITQRDKNTVRQSVMLDVTESGGLDMGKGKNVGLGRLREAIGMNVAGQPFSFRMIEGKVAKLTIGHRPSDKDPADVFADVKGIAKLA
jgi:hypothetical protein